MSSFITDSTSQSYACATALFFITTTYTLNAICPRPTDTSPTVSKPTVMSLTVITQTAISPAASGSDDKIDKWHMHMTRTDGSRGSGSDDKRD